METRAPYALIGLFVLAAVGAVFGFVYWMHNTGGLGERAVYRVRFEHSVSGVLVGSAVMFNGIRVGEVTDLKIGMDNPQQVTATISVSPATPSSRTRKPPTRSSSRPRSTTSTTSSSTAPSASSVTVPVWSCRRWTSSRTPARTTAA